jgi:hypothetical protein
MFGRKGKAATCFYCSESVDSASDLILHYQKHLVPVTDNNGLQAYTFTCPRCGPMNLSWGGGMPDEAAQSKASGMLRAHLVMKHNY